MNRFMSKVLDLGKKHVRQEATPLVEPELLRQGPLPLKGLFALLDDEQKKSSLSFKEYEGFGSADLKRCTS